MARSFSGLSRNGDMGELVRLLADPAERAMARRTGFVIEQATDGFVRASRQPAHDVRGGQAESGLNGFARRLPAAVIRLQGLTGLVAARRRAFRLEMMGHLRRARPDLRISAPTSPQDGRWRGGWMRGASPRPSGT